MTFSYYKQETTHTCGPASLRMVLEHFGIKESETEIANFTKSKPHQGIWFKDFYKLVRKSKLNHISGSGSIPEIRKLIESGYQIIVCYIDAKDKSHGFLMDHYSVVRKIDRKYIYFFDPWYGPNHRYSINHFRKIWKSRDRPDKVDRWFIAIKN